MEINDIIERIYDSKSMTCDCGRRFNKKNLSRHYNTQIHQMYLNHIREGKKYSIWTHYGEYTDLINKKAQEKKKEARQNALKESQLFD